MICFVPADFISFNRMVFWSFPAGSPEKGILFTLGEPVRIIFCIPSVKEGSTMRRETTK
jgi:hypothetical protein